MLGIMIVSPLLLTALIVGLFVSLVQAVTQVQEMTLTFIPKILAVVSMLIYVMPWMSSKVMDYAREMFGYLSKL
jgi:flagellar biosynthetic protein FliQ